MARKTKIPSIKEPLPIHREGKGVGHSPPPPADHRSSAAVSEFIGKLEEEMKLANQAHAVVAQDLNEVRRKQFELRGEISKLRQQMAALDVEKHSKKVVVDKARENIIRLKTEIAIQWPIFWAKKNSGE